MKKSITNLALVLSLMASAAIAAPPVPPVGVFAPAATVAPQTNAISAPVGFFPVALVYVPSSVIKPATSTMLQWQPSADPTVTTYNFYFGDIMGTNAFPKLTVPKAVSSVVLLSLNTNVVYGFYVTAVNSGSEESAPSSLVLLKPGTISP
jgi:hypothetical protein